MNIRCRSVAAWVSLVIGLVLAAPAPAQGVEGKKYALGSFDAVVFNGTAGVRLVQGAEDSIFVEGDAETQEAVDLDVEAGVLRVRPSGSWKFWRGKQIQIVVTARDLRRLEIKGAADIVAADAAAPEATAGEHLRRRLGAFRQAHRRAARLQCLRLGHRAARGCRRRAQRPDLGPRRLSRREPRQPDRDPGGQWRRRSPDLDDEGIDGAGVGSRTIDFWARRQSREATPGSRPGTIAATAPRSASPARRRLEDPGAARERCASRVHLDRTRLACSTTTRSHAPRGDGRLWDHARSLVEVWLAGGAGHA